MASDFQSILPENRRETCLIRIALDRKWHYDTSDWIQQVQFTTDKLDQKLDRLTVMESQRAVDQLWKYHCPYTYISNTT